MGIGSKLKTVMTPGQITKQHPVMAGRDEYKRGGNWMSVATAALDPGELLGNNRTPTAKESAAKLAGMKAKAQKRREGMKAGGKTRANCRGMGKATRGGGFGK